MLIDLQVALWDTGNLSALAFVTPLSAVTSGDGELTVSDTLPILSATLTDGDGAAIDLTSATSATLYLQRRTGLTTVLKATMTIDTDPTTGIVTYAWESADLGHPPGRYNWWVVAAISNRVATFHGNVPIRLLPDN